MISDTVTTAWSSSASNSRLVALLRAVRRRLCPFNAKLAAAPWQMVQVRDVLSVQHNR